MWRCSCVRAKVFVRLKLSVVFSEGSADGRPIFSSASVNGLMLKFSMSPVTRGFTKPVNMTVRFNQKTHTHVDWFNNNGTIHTLCASVKRAAPINFHTRKIKMQKVTGGYERIYLTQLRGLSPRTNYTDRAAAAGRRSQCQRLRIEGCHVVSATDPHGR